MELDRCRDLREHFVPFVVGNAPRSVELRLELHLAQGCAACASDIDDLQTAWYAIPLSMPPQPLLDGAPALLARNVGSRPQEMVEVPIVYPETNERRLLVTLVILFGVALFAAALWGRSQVGA